MIGARIFRHILTAALALTGGATLQAAAQEPDSLQIAPVVLPENPVLPPDTQNTPAPKDTTVVVAQTPAPADTVTVEQTPESMPATDSLKTAETPETTVVEEAPAEGQAPELLEQTPAPADTVIAEQTPVPAQPDSAAVAQLLAAVEEQRLKARELRRNYDFPGAVALCKEAIAQADTLAGAKLEEELVLAQNGLNMMQFSSTPKVVTSHTFPLKNFFLFYPLPQESWRRVPNVLDPRGAGGIVEAMYVPEGSQDIYYSAKDEVGVRNIYHTHLGDSTWTAPKLINEHTTSSSDEIYPMLGSDGKSLYFASKGLYGMGGYDLYVSKWNEVTQDWDVPVNLGFPYSSPYDDFLYINTDDGKYTIFASNRECGQDSVKVYVLEYDVLPVRKHIESAEELKELASLRQTPSGNTRGNLSTVTGPMQEDANTTLYMEKMTKLRRLRRDLTEAGKTLDALRSSYAGAAPEEKEAMRAEILKRELELPAMQNEVNVAAAELQKVELEFLMKGIVIDPDAISTDADKEVVGGVDSYLFSRNDWGAPLDIVVDKPKPVFDYGFKVLETGQFAADNSLPDGLVYQIQMASFLRQLGEDELKGLSPVFERIAGGKFIYSVGLFSSYSEALSKLNSVKRAGWRGATITAFRDGEPIPIQTARRLEAMTVTLYKVRIAPADGLNLNDMALSAIHQQTDCDIARTMEGAAVMYEVGPFEERQKCEELRSTLIATGEPNVMIMESGKLIPEQ